MTLTLQNSIEQNPSRFAKRGAQLVGAAVVAGLTYQAIRTTVRARRELTEFKKSDSLMRSELTGIVGVTDTALRVHARVADEARPGFPPVVLVHGFGIGSSYLVPLAGRIAGSLQVYVPDLPGHGRSDHDERPLTIPEFARVLGAWMETSQIRSAILVGHSMGAQIAAELAKERPALVAGLVLIAPTADASSRVSSRTIARGLFASFFDRPTYAAWTSRDYKRAGREVLSAEIRQINSHRIEEVLEQVHVPTRVIRGERDAVVPQSWAETVAQAAQAPAPTVLPKCGHAVHYDDPDSVAEVILDLAQTITLSRERVEDREAAMAST